MILEVLYFQLLRNCFLRQLLLRLRSESLGYAIISADGIARMTLIIRLRLRQLYHTQG